MPPASPAALADVLERYVHDAGLTAAQSRASRQRAEHEFSLGGMLGHYADLYTELLPHTARQAA